MTETKATAATDDAAGEQPQTGHEAGARSLPAQAVSDVRSASLTGIFVLLLFYMLYFASPVLIPITLAVLLNLLLTPGVELLVRLRLPQSLAAAVMLLGALALLFGAVYMLAGPAQEWLQKAPDSFYKIERKLQALRQPIEKIQEASEQIQQATKLETPAAQTQQVEIKRPGLTDMLLSGTPQVLAAVGVVIILLYFLLASGDLFLRKLVGVIPTLNDKKRAVEIVRSIQEDISFYLTTVTLINLGLGVCVAVMLTLMQVPNPLLWGAMVTLLNFAPYVGASINLLVLSMVGMLTFDDLASSLLVPGIFALLTVTASNVVLPMVLGRRLLLSPVAIFIAILVWGWLWGVIGALLAVPLLASVKIVCERIEPLNPIAEFLTP